MVSVEGLTMGNLGSRWTVSSLNVQRTGMAGCCVVRVAGVNCTYVFIVVEGYLGEMFVISIPLQHKPLLDMLTEIIVLTRMSNAHQSRVVDTNPGCLLVRLARGRLSTTHETFRLVQSAVNRLMRRCSQNL